MTVAGWRQRPTSGTATSSDALQLLQISLPQVPVLVHSPRDGKLLRRFLHQHPKGKGWLWEQTYTFLHWVTPWEHFGFHQQAQKLVKIKETWPDFPHIPRTCSANKSVTFSCSVVKFCTQAHAATGCGGIHVYLSMAQKQLQGCLARSYCTQALVFLRSS